MSKKNLNLTANKLVNAFLKNKIIAPISSKYTKKLENAQKLRKRNLSKLFGKNTFEDVICLDTGADKDCCSGEIHYPK